MAKRTSTKPRNRELSKYRQIDLRLWNDRRFLALSDHAKLLWVFFLTTPASLPIPGVIIGGDHTMAELLNWPVERYRECFRELLQTGMRVRREGRLIWLSNAFKYQPSPNPNKIRCWAKCFCDIPEGQLKAQIWQELRTACSTWKMFDKLFPHPNVEPFAQRTLEGFQEPLPERRTPETETEVETEVEKETEGGGARAGARDPSTPPPTALRAGSFFDAQNPEPPEPVSVEGSGDRPPIASAAPPPKPPREPVLVRDPDADAHRALVDDWTARYRKKNRGASPTWNTWTHETLADLLKSHSPEEIHRRMALAFEHPPSWPQHPFDVKTFARSFDLFAQKPDDEREKPPPKSRDYHPRVVHRNEVPPVLR